MYNNNSIIIYNIYTNRATNAIAYAENCISTRTNNQLEHTNSLLGGEYNMHLNRDSKMVNDNFIYFNWKRIGLAFKIAGHAKSETVIRILC